MAPPQTQQRRSLCTAIGTTEGLTGQGANHVQKIRYPFGQRPLLRRSSLQAGMMAAGRSIGPRGAHFPSRLVFKPGAFGNVRKLKVECVLACQFAAIYTAK